MPQQLCATLHERERALSAYTRRCSNRNTRPNNARRFDKHDTWSRDTYMPNGAPLTRVAISSAELSSCALASRPPSDSRPNGPLTKGSPFRAFDHQSRSTRSAHLLMASSVPLLVSSAPLLLSLVLLLVFSLDCKLKHGRLCLRC